MPKVKPLTEVENIPVFIQQVNSNFEKVEEALENTISRDGSTPNEMNADLDMNGQNIINIGGVSFVDGPWAVSFGARDTSEYLVSDTLTLDAATVTSATITVQAETTTADDLATISGGFDGQRIVLRAVSGHTITVKNGSGYSSDNIRTGTGSDLVMTYGTGDEKIYEFQRYDGVWIRVQ